MTRSEELLDGLSNSMQVDCHEDYYAYWDNEIERQLRTRLVALEAVLEAADELYHHRYTERSWRNLITKIKSAKEAK